MTYTTQDDFIIKTNEDGTQTWIPKDEANSDYQAYLAWLEDPNAEITPPQPDPEPVTVDPVP